MVLVAAAAAGILVAADPLAWRGDDHDPEAESTQTERSPTQDLPAPDLPTSHAKTACLRLAMLADELAEAGGGPVAFIRALARDAAGIRPGNRTLIDLARGGRDLIPGRGFREEFDDGSAGQVRHFAGVALATLLGGGEQTRAISERLRGDARNSPDGLLTEEAIAFTRRISDGDLEPAEGGDWIRSRLCSPG